MRKCFVSAILLFVACFLGAWVYNTQADGGSGLSVSLNAPATARPGDTFLYTFNYANNSDTSATGLVLTDRLPFGVKYVPGSLSAGGSCAGSAVTFHLGDLAARSTGSASVKVKVAAEIPKGVSLVNSNYMITGPNGGSVSGAAAVTQIEQPVTVRAASGPGSIVYDSKRNADPNFEIYLANADGSSETRLTSNSARNIFPALSADGTKVAFLSDRSGTLEIYVMNAAPESASNPAVQLTNNQGAEPSIAGQSAPAWSPNGKQIAYSATRQGSALVATVTNLTPQSQSNQPVDLGVFGVANLQFSPDGTRLLGAEPGGNLELIYLATDTNGLVTGKSNIVASSYLFTTDDNVLQEYPTWNPDGTQIAFDQSALDLDTLQPAGSYDLYLMDVNTKKRTKLTNGNGDSDARRPTWSPDGSRIAYESTGAAKSTGGATTDGITTIVSIKPQPVTAASGDNYPLWIAAGADNPISQHPKFAQVSGAAPPPVLTYLAKGAYASAADANNGISIISARQGDTFVYAIRYYITNNSSAALSNVTLTDFVPEGADYVSGGNSSVFDTSHVTSDGSSRRGVVFNVGAIAAGGSSSGVAEFTVKVTGAPGSTITNAATDFYVLANTKKLYGNGDVLTKVSGTPLPLPQLSISKSADVTSVAPNGQISYTMAYGNQSTSTASSAQTVATDAVPDGTTFVAAHFVNAQNSVITTYDGNITRPAVGGVGTVTYKLGALAANQTSGIKLQLIVKATGNKTSVVNTASISDPGTPNTPAHNSNSVSVSVATPQLPNLFLQKRANINSVRPGGQIIYTITYGNSTGSAASSTRTQAADALPAHTSFVSAHFVNQSGQVFTAYENNITRPAVGSHNQIVVYQLGTLASGLTSQALLQLTVKVDSDLTAAQAASIQNTAAIADLQNTNATLKISNTLTTPVQFGPTAPDLFIEKRANINSVMPGGQIIYTMTYGNRAGAAASSTGTQAADALPAHTSFVSAHFVNQNGQIFTAYENNIARPSGANNAVVVYQLGSLAPGLTSQTLLQLTVKVDSNLTKAQATSIQNAAAIADLQNTNATLKISNTLTTPVQFGPDLFIQKSANVTSVKPGNQIVYTMAYGNRAGATASSALTGASDIVPAGTTFVSAHFVNATGQTYTAYESNVTEATVNGKQQVNWNLGALQPGVTGQVFLQLTVQVNSNLTPAQQPNIVNQASIFDAISTGSLRASNTVTTPVTVTPPRPAHLWIGLAGPPIQAGRGDILTYTVTYGNSGDLPANSVTVRTRINLDQVNLPANPIDNGGTLQTITTGDRQPLIVWLLDSVPAHGMGTLTFRVQVKPGTAPSGFIDLNSIEILIRTAHPPSPVLDTCFPSRISIVSASPLATARSSTRAVSEGASSASTVQVRADNGNIFANALNAFLNALGSVKNSIGGFFFNLNGQNRANAALQKDLETLNANSMSMSSGRIDIIALKNGVTMYPNGDGTVMVVGPASLIQTQPGVHIVAQGGGNIVAQGGGNIVAQGGGNLITVVGVLGPGGNIVAQGGGNIIVSNLVANIVAQGGGNIVAQGGGNIVAQGGGNIVAQGGGNLISNDGNSLGPALARSPGLLQPGGSLTTTTGSGASAVAPSQLLAGGGAIVAQGGGNIAQVNGGQLIVSGNALIGQDGNGLIGQDGNG